jgi:hypothetical protein
MLCMCVSGGGGVSFASACLYSCFLERIFCVTSFAHSHKKSAELCKDRTCLGGKLLKIDVCEEG